MTILIVMIFRRGSIRDKKGMGGQTMKKIAELYRFLWVINMENKKILSSITKERKLEIDEILKKTEGDISAGNIKTISLEEFNNNIEKIKENIRNGGKE